MVPVNTLKNEFGAIWQLLFYHDTSTGKFFDDTTINFVNDEFRYSTIGGISQSYKVNGYFEYLLEYPDEPHYNRWKQRINLKDTTNMQTSEDIGYKPIHIDFNGPGEDGKFGGIAR